LLVKLFEPEEKLYTEEKTLFPYKGSEETKEQDPSSGALSPNFRIREEKKTNPGRRKKVVVAVPREIAIQGRRSTPSRAPSEKDRLGCSVRMSLVPVENSAEGNFNRESLSPEPRKKEDLLEERVSKREPDPFAGRKVELRWKKPRRKKKVLSSQSTGGEQTKGVPFVYRMEAL